MEEVKELKTDVLIIGGGPVGIQASRMLGGLNPNLEVSVVRPESHSMVYCAIPYAIEGIVPLEKTFKKDSLITVLAGNFGSDNGASYVEISTAKNLLKRI